LQNLFSCTFKELRSCFPYCLYQIKSASRFLKSKSIFGKINFDIVEKKYCWLAFLAVLMFSCSTRAYRTIDYVTVGKMMDTAKVPYVIDLKNGKKRLVFIGCDHSRDTTSGFYKVIGQYFKELKPEIAFNEGGQVADSVHFASAAEGFQEKSETGTLKYWSDLTGIRMMNGDIPDSQEFAITLKRYPADRLFLYYIMERLVIPYLSGAYGNTPFEELYPKAVKKWFVQEGFPLDTTQQSLAYFRQIYRQYIGHDFELKLTEDIEKFDYINGGDCYFCEIGRTSKMVRDSVLLVKIDSALKRHDRVIVTFGLGHALAIQPALKKLMSKAGW
jgi:hypothetical protein